MYVVGGREVGRQADIDKESQEEARMGSGVVGGNFSFIEQLPLLLTLDLS